MVRLHHWTEDLRQFLLEGLDSFLEVCGLAKLSWRQVCEH